MRLSFFVSLKLFLFIALSVAPKFAIAKDISDWPSIYKQAQESVAILFQNGGLCSGSLIAPNRILTAAHCVDALKEVTVMWSDAKTQETAQVVALDSKHDLALIVLDKATTRPVIPILENADSLNVGDEVVAIGHPFGSDFFASNGLYTDLNFILSRGIISKINSTSLITDVSISPGNSGGPVLNRRGEIVGVVSKKMIGSGAGQVGYVATSGQVLDLLSGVKGDDKLAFWNAKGQPIIGFGYFVENESENDVDSQGWDIQFGYSFFRRFSLVYGNNIPRLTTSHSGRYVHKYIEASYIDTVAQITPLILLDAGVFIQRRFIERSESSAEQKTILGARLSALRAISLSVGFDVKNFQSYFSVLSFNVGL